MATVTGRWVRYGGEAAVALLAEIRRAKGAEPLAPVTVVVASNQVGVSVRRQLASGRYGPMSGAGPGLVGVTFVTPYRLAELLGAPALSAQGRRPVSAPVLAAGVRSVLADEPGVFAPVTDHPATEAALVAAYKELRDLDGASLDRLGVRGGRAGEVVRVVRATRRHLEEGWYDEEDLMAAATAAAGSGPRLDAVGSVIVYLPQRLSNHAAVLLRAVGAANRLVVLAGSTGVVRADAEVAASVRRLDAALAPAPERSPLAMVSPATTRIVTASDADDEVRAAVRTVVDAVRRGTSLDRIAVVHASHDPYSRLLHDHLDAAGVATNGLAEVPLAGRLAGRSLLTLLALSHTGYRRQDVFAWISSAPVLQGGRPAPTTAWERISRSAGVVAGRSDWDELLAGLAHRFDTRASEVDPDDDQVRWKADRDRRDAQLARDLRHFVLDLIGRLTTAAAGPRPWSEQVRWARHIVADLLGDAARRQRWPEVERRAADRVELALDRLAALDAVEPPVTVEVFARTLAVELESDLGRRGRFGEGVLVGPVSMGVGVDVDLLVVLGMAEGTFPSVVREDSLLPDADREAVGGALALRREHVDRLHHQFLAAMGGASSQLLGVPRGDLRRSRTRVPSRWALDVASELAGDRWWTDELLGADAPWVTHIASFDAGLRNAASPATAQEHRLRALLAAAPARRDLHDTASVVDASLAAGVDVLDARSGPHLTRFDGNLAGIEVASPIEHGSSATRLESWARCPHAYFMKDILRVEPIEEPEDLLEVDPRVKGNLIHEALELFVGAYVQDGTVPDPAVPWSASQHRRLADLAGRLGDDLHQRGQAGRPIFWRRDRRRILDDLDQFLFEDDVYRAGAGARPVAVELPFGIEGTEPVRFPLDDGRTVALRGKADRIDRAEDGTLLVLDYKTGKAKDFKGLSADAPHQGGRRLQLAVYGLAARQHLGEPDATARAHYWFNTSKEKFARLGYAVTDEVVASVGAAIATIVSSIEAGLFPPRPQPHTTSPFTECEYCDPDGLGTSEVLRQWLHKQDDPTLVPYRALIAPSPDDDTDDDPEGQR